MVGGVNFRQIWAWMSDGSGFSGSWERLTGIEATQDEVEEGLVRERQRKDGPTTEVSGEVEGKAKQNKGSCGRCAQSPSGGDRST